MRVGVPSGKLATLMDVLQLRRQGVSILAPMDVTRFPHPARPGADVARELGGRPLLRYLTPAQQGRFLDGATERTYVTPTAYSPEEAIPYLLLPVPTVPRTLALILDPARITWVIGPMWAADGRGIQYILPEGFPRDAIIVPGAPGMRWEVSVD
jgi:hypothetical protein